MRKLAYLILLIFVVSMSTACKDVCERAADVTENDCGIEPTDEGDGEGEDQECTGDTEASAQCVVDNKDAYCEWLDKLSAGEFDFTNAYTECLADAGVGG